jgi:8-oxo-dGTP pyrophosphatase MutT (NUDIX family)
MNHFISCGFLIQSADRFLLCHPSNLQIGKLKGDQGWGLPKGKLDSPEESRYKCALRETKEETNLDLVALQERGYKINICPTAIYNVEYLSHHQGDRISKEVHIFHAVEESGMLQDEPVSCPSLVEGTTIPEMDDFRWVTAEEARRICTRSLKDLFENIVYYTPMSATKIY